MHCTNLKQCDTIINSIILFLNNNIADIYPRSYCLNLGILSNGLELEH